MMSEETVVLTRRHGIHEQFRYILEFNQAAFRARCGRKGSSPALEKQFKSSLYSGKPAGLV